MRLLLVEDDPMIGESVEEGLLGEGYAVDWVNDGRLAAAALTANVPDAYDAVLLDLGLPGRSGEDVLRLLRGRGMAVPVLILTARDATADRVRGLDAGADDYLVKPFDLDELFARVRALIRRSAGRVSTELAHGRVRLDPAAREVRCGGDIVALSMREFMVLQALMEQPGHVVTHERLREAVYTMNEEISSNAVEVHIHALRKKLGAEFIRNVRGIGYKLGNPA
ncbi:MULTISPECIES: response regulator [Cupriavidus]